MTLGQMDRFRAHSPTLIFRAAPQALVRRIHKGAVRLGKFRNLHAPTAAAAAVAGGEKRANLLRNHLVISHGRIVRRRVVRSIRTPLVAWRAASLAASEPASTQRQLQLNPAASSLKTVAKVTCHRRRGSSSRMAPASSGAGSTPSGKMIHADLVGSATNASARFRASCGLTPTDAARSSIPRQGQPPRLQDARLARPESLHEARVKQHCHRSGIRLLRRVQDQVIRELVLPSGIIRAGDANARKNATGSASHRNAPMRPQNW